MTKISVARGLRRRAALAALSAVLSTVLAACGSGAGASPPPSLSSVAPASGPSAGGSTVTIDGAGFEAGAHVRFDGLEGAQVQVASATRISAVAPAHAAGPVDVVVVGADGRNATLTGAFTYVDAPSLSFVDPGHLPQAGGTVVLHGQAFGVGARVLFGAAASVGDAQWLSATQLVAAAPAHGPGTVDVSVVNADGQQVTLFAALSYDPAPPPPPTNNPPLLTTVSPVAGTETGGTVVVLTGTDFDPLAVVTFGASPATITNHTATSITVSTPGHAPGPVDVSVQNPDGQRSTRTGGFSYVAVPPPPPVLASVSPASGPETGGSTVVLSGSAFQPGATVTFGGAAAAVQALQPGSITVTTPAHPAGVEAVMVMNPDGQQAVLATGFTFLPTPVLAVSGVSPASGPSAGGTLVTIGGSGFAAGATVTVGGVAATGVVVSGAASITATTPAHAAGLVPVVVRNPDGRTASLATAFTYVTPAPPTLASVSPVSGPDLGGTVVTLAGSGFAPGVTVRFGATAAAPAVVLSATSITITAPAHAAGAVDVAVQNLDGQASSLLAGYTYLPPPQLAAATPSSGPVAGGTRVTLAGAGFQPGAQVTFGGLAAAVVSVASSGVVVTAPAHAAGPVSVVVQNPDGRQASLASGFTYLAPPPPAPTIATVAPASGSTLGGTSVVVGGANFDAAATVTLGGANAAVSARSATSLTVTTPAHAAGAVDVVVTNGDGQSATLAGGFAYVAPPAPPPAIAGVSPASGPSAGGTAVVLTGAAFQAGLGVTFGGAPALVGTVTATNVTVTAPAHAAGSVAIAVTNPDGQAVSAAAAFTYLAPPPALASLSPAQGPDAGGTLATLSGTGFQAGATVAFGGGAAVVGTVSATSILAQAPAHAAGAVDVTVTNPDGQASTLHAAFTFVAPPPPPPVLPPPTLASVFPGSGPTAGGTAVGLSGADFQAGATVTFGGVSAAVGSVAATSIAVTAPAHAAGPVDVTVLNPDGQAVTLPGAFTYVAPPSLVAATPGSGLTTGGTAVTLAGSGFTAGSTVTFGGVAATVGLRTATSLAVTAPAHAAGPVAVTVTNADGQASTLAAAFTYVLPPPAVATVSPGSGTTLGGTAVTVSGTGFAAGAAVTLGGSAAAVGVVTATSIALTTPAHAAGAVSLVVTNPDGQAAAVTSAYTYVAPPPPPPALASISPVTGPDAGGTVVVLSGSNFLAGATVTFGGAAAVVGTVTATSISATTPAHLAGAVDVTVTNPGGQASTLAAAYTFVAPPPPPVVSTVLPASGTTAGGTAASVSGAAFQAGATVTFGGVAAAVVSSSATAIGVTTPAHAAGAVDVTVLNPDGRSSTLPAAFTYVAPPPPPPTLTGLSPVSGTTVGGTSVTLAGSAFQAGATVTFGGAAAAVTASGATSITATTPAHAAGTVDVVVTNPGGQSATLPAAFAFVAPPPPPVLASLSPTSGSTAGATHVVLAGSGFAAGATVKFGASAATVESVAATAIALASPPGAAGVVAVTVTNPDGQASTLLAAYTYLVPPPPPTLASATPANGPIAGGTAVVLAGTGFVGGATVTVGGVAATITGQSATAISITTPAHAAGAVDVVVTNPDLQAATLVGGFTYLAPPPPPVLASVAPASGGTAGGSPVTLGGTGFAAGATVTFGGVSAVVGAVTPTSIAVTAPAHAAGAVDVVVTNPGGQSSTLVGGFSYTAVLGPPPLITSVTPGTGFDVGGTTVTISGNEFVNPFVTFGGVAVVPSANTKTSITVVTPPHAAGLVSVVVTNADGQAATLASGFTYVVLPVQPPPVVTSITPASGSQAGNTVVTITGTGFSAGTTVTFAGVAGIMGPVTATTITVTTPGGPAGPVDVVVTNFDRQTATVPGGFLYVAPPPVVLAINVRGAPQAGGVPLLLAGTGLGNAVSVTFGGAPATNLTFDPVRNALTVTVPPSPLGPTADGFVDIVVTNVDRQSTTFRNFHYGNPPRALSFTPTTGPRGISVNITGLDFSADTTGLRVGLQVQFGSTPAIITAKTPTLITVTVPKLNPGNYTLVVVNFDSQLSIAPGTFLAPGP